MTAAQLFGALARRWYILLAGLGCTCAAFLLLGQSGTVYAAQSDYVFVVPGVPGESRQLTTAEPQTLIDFTAIVERKVLTGTTPAKLASPSASLFGTGIREGTSINMLDSGGQWVPSFSRPVLSVQVAAPSPAAVRDGMDAVLAEVRKVSTELQRESGAEPGSFITVERSPEDLNITSFGKTRTGEVKAFAALAAAGLGLSCAAAAAVDSAAGRRTGRTL